MASAIVTIIVALAFGPVLSGGDLEQEARAIEASLIAPCCFSQQVSVHQSPAAEEARRDIRARLRAGETRQEILDAYVHRYGKRILAEPPAVGFDLTLHVMPFVVLLASIGLVAAILRRFTTRESTAALPADAAVVSVPLTRYDVRLDDELRDLD